MFSQGERADAVFYIQEGRVRLSVLSKQGKEATIALLGPGDFLAEGCLASDQPLRMAAATAITNCSVLRIERQQILRTLHAEHGFSDMFVAYVGGTSQPNASGPGRSTVQFERKASGPSALNTGPLREKDRPETVFPNVSQETLAEMIGTTRSRVNFFMNKFRKLGFIHYNGGLQVHSSLLGVVLHD